MKPREYILSVILFLVGCAPSSKHSSKTSGTDNTAVSSTNELAPDRFQKQLERGVDFLAAGNEPSWSLEINFDSSMHFKTLSGFEITVPAVEGVKAMDADVTRYHANTEKGSLTVQVTKKECVDNMSGEKMQYGVTIDTKINTEKDYTGYKGCGRYLADYRLHDIWVLESIDDIPLNASGFAKGLPRLELLLNQQKVYGYTGCNEMSGSMEVQGKKIRFGQLASTKMTCSNAEFENSYLKSLSNQAMRYSLSGLKLQLTTASGTVYKYRKVD